MGAGRVGTAVSILLRDAGHAVVGIASRTLDSALRASQRLDADVYRVEDLPPADLVLLGATDPAIEPLAAEVAHRVREGASVCHFSGSLGTGPLRAVLDVSASGCAIHPVQACPSVDAAVARLPGSAWGVTCTDPGAEDRIVEIIDRDLAGSSVVIPEELRPLWHAAAVMTSNGIAALLAAGEALLAEIGVDDPAHVLGPLATGTVQNARDGHGGAATLTGPVVRGEVATVRRHMQALMDAPGQHAETYRIVCALILRSAVSAGRIDVETLEKVMRELAT